MTPESPLPYVDELTVDVTADRNVTWAALLRVVEGSFASARGRGPARLLGCEDAEPSGPRPLAQGSAFPGFHVETAEPGNRLALAGRHRFSTYLLTFRLADAGADRTKLTAETRAAFPGLTGGIYRALVIGTRLHVLVTRRLLTASKRRAERS
ncbi:MAG TPA: hypothetical protein VFS48_06610 [Solirubrobacterales bacterium]|nr:hypothetical protein [Solirubrobacterales bacterium]